jgi:hypothetical protein
MLDNIVIHFQSYLVARINGLLARQEVFSFRI